MFFGFILAITLQQSAVKTAAEAVAQNQISFAVPTGALVIQNPDFLKRIDDFHNSPRLSFELINRSTSYWSLRLIARETGTCDGQPTTWEQTIDLVIGYSDKIEMKKNYSDVLLPLLDWADHCRADSITIDLVRAYNDDVEVGAKTGTTIDLAKKRSAEEAADRKRLQIESSRIAAEEAKEAAERAKAAKAAADLRATCRAVFRETADKIVSQLTVREQESINVCKRAGMYAP